MQFDSRAETKKSINYQLRAELETTKRRLSKPDRPVGPVEPGTGPASDQVSTENCSAREPEIHYKKISDLLPLFSYKLYLWLISSYKSDFLLQMILFILIDQKHHFFSK
jgi:hypothetical protein